MARVKINIPEKPPLFQTKIPLRITDMNYGGHLGNDRMLAIAQEARVQWLASIGFSELNIGNCGLIMADAAVVYKREVHYGDVLRVSVYAGDITKVSFDLLFRVQIDSSPKSITVADIKTGMVAYDYDTQKVVPLPDVFKHKL